MTPARARASLLVATAAWGMTFVANHELLEVLDPRQVTVLRFGAVALAFLLLLVFRPSLRPRLSGREWALMAGCGLLAVPGSQLALTHGQLYLSPAMSSLVVATGPAFAAVLAVALLGERLGRRSVGGIALAFAGAAVVIVFTSGTGTDLTVRNPWGAALVAVAQLCWAAFTVLSKDVVRRHPPLTIVAVAVIAGSLSLAPFVPDAVASAASLDGARWMWLAHLAILGTVVPYLIWFTALRQLEANQTAVFMFLIPLFAVTWSALILGERPALLGVLGGAAIVGGVALTQLTGRTSAAPDPLPTPEVEIG